MPSLCAYCPNTTKLFEMYQQGNLSPEALADLNARYPEVAEINRLEQQRQMVLNNAHKDGFAIDENDNIMATLGGKYDIKALKSAGFQESLGVRLLNYSNRPAAAAPDTEALTKAITDQGVSQEDAGKIVAGMQQKMNSGIDPQSALKDAWEEVFVPLDPWEQRLRLQQQDKLERQERMRPKFRLGDKGTGDWDKDKDILIDQYDSELQRWMNERLTPDYYLSARGIFPEINFDAYLDVFGIEHEEHEKQKNALRFSEVNTKLDQGVALYDLDPNLLGTEVKVSPAKNAKERMERLFTWARILKLDVAVFPQSEDDLLLRYLSINTNVDPDLVDKGSKDIKNLYTTWDDELRAQTRMPSFSAGATLAIDAATDPQNIGVHLITPDEAAQINYYYGKGDYDKADKLFFYYKDKHATEYAQTMAAGFASTDSDVLKISLALLSWAPATAYAAETVGNAIVGGGRATPESMASMALRTINAGQASVVDKIDSPVGRFFAQAGFSIVQNAPLLATGPAAPYIMAISAAGHASLDAKDRGATGWQQLGEAVAYGMAEYLGEKVSLGGLNKIINSTGKKTFLNFIKKVGAQMGTEFTEESATEVMQILSDVAIMGDKSEMAIYFQNYLKEHPGEQTDAILATVAKAATQVLYAGGQGVISGLGFGGGATAINYVLPSSIQAPVGGGYGIDFNTSIQNLSESISSRVDRITAALQGKINQQINTYNNFLWNQTNPSFNPYSQPAFALAGGTTSRTRFIDNGMANMQKQATTNLSNTNITFEQTPGQNDIVSGQRAMPLIQAIDQYLPDVKLNNSGVKKQIYVETDGTNQIVRIEPLDTSKGLRYYTAKVGNVGRIYEPIAGRGKVAFTDVTLQISENLVVQNSIKAIDRIAKSSTKNKNKIKKRFYTFGDALRNTLGPAWKSHQEEYRAILNHAKELGVVVEFRIGACFYEITSGSPGKMVLDPDASIGAVLHEYRHMLDDFDLGHPGLRIFMDREAAWRIEYRGYMEEINLARLFKDYDAARFIIKEMRKRKSLIFGNE